jgi:hypothetical protein
VDRVSSCVAVTVTVTVSVTVGRHRHPRPCAGSAVTRTAQNFGRAHLALRGIVTVDLVDTVIVAVHLNGNDALVVIASP